jgi:threonine synthase
MDILISSNLERLIYRICGNDAVKTAEFMKELSSDGKYDITDEMKAQLDDFYGGFATEEENFAGIRDLYEKTGYVIDTHTGIANAVYRAYVEKTGDTTPTVIASTASPFKFAVSVVGAIAPEKLSGRTDFELIDILSELSGTAEPYAITDIRTAPVRHKTVVDACDMPAEVRKILGVS